MKRFTLAIDTSQGTAAAVLDGAVVLSEHYEENTMQHAELVGSVISKVLDLAKIKASEIGYVAVGVGPAPFTGLRVGIAAAKLFAIGVGAKLYSVSSLDAAAFALAIDKPTLVLTDARRGEVYFALYSGKTSSGIPVIVLGPGVSKQVELEANLKSTGQSYKVEPGAVSAAMVGKLFFAKLQDGQAIPGASANYLRAPDAVPSKAKKVSG